MPIRTGTRRDRIIRVPGIVAESLFTAADATAITALTPAWTKHATGSSNTAAPAVAANRIVGENANTISVYYRADWVPASPDYAVECDVVLVTDNNLSINGPVGRLATAAATYYHARYNTATNVWQLFKFVAGVGTQLGADAAAVLTANQNYRCRLDLRGAQIALVVDGAVLVSATDAAITAPGVAGVRIFSNATSTTGLHLDTWAVRQ